MHLKTNYVSGLGRNTNQGANDNITFLEEEKCPPAPAPEHNTPTICRNVNWGVLDKLMHII